MLQEFRCIGKLSVQVSTNETDWTEVYSSSSCFGGTECIFFAPAQARYVRMVGIE